MKKHRSNPNWVHRHVHDAYVQKAQREGYRSRAAYKLLEIDAKDRLLRPGACVIDLGSAPGAWSQVCARRLGQNATVLAVDILPMDPIPGVRFLQGDIREATVHRALKDALGAQPVDVVLSDMAPNLSGIAVTDAARAYALAEEALAVALQFLHDEGVFLVKVFQGTGFDEYRRLLQRTFAQVSVRKPAASRNESSECYLLARRPVDRSWCEALETSDHDLPLVPGNPSG